MLFAGKSKVRGFGTTKKPNHRLKDFRRAKPKSRHREVARIIEKCVQYPSKRIFKRTISTLILKSLKISSRKHFKKANNYHLQSFLITEQLNSPLIVVKIISSISLNSQYWPIGILER